jgi:hypothetical protein
LETLCINNLEERSWVLGQVHVYCYLVSRGKPVATIMIRSEYVDDVLREIDTQGFGCSGIVDLNEATGWVDIWIYCQPFMLEVIKAYREVCSDLPAVLRFWITGCLFGYSQTAIENAWQAM